MNNIKIFLGHAIADASPQFLRSMRGLIRRLQSIDGVEISSSFWAGDDSLNPGLNVFDMVTAAVNSADLAVFIVDIVSPQLMVELVERCKNNENMICFIQEELVILQIIPDCISSHRGEFGAEHIRPPIRYRNFGEIVFFVSEWVEDKRKQEMAL